MGKLMTIDQLGAVVAVLFYASAIAVFTARLLGAPRAGFYIGIFEFCLALPLIWMLARAPALGRPALYYVQIALLLAWLCLELFLDYILRLEFRSIRWLLIFYVTLFFAAGGGMLGVASRAGGGWTAVSAVLFLVMAVLAFVQRWRTGM